MEKVGTKKHMCMPKKSSTNMEVSGSLDVTRRYRIRSECVSSTAPCSAHAFLLDSSNVVDPIKSAQKGFCNKRLSNTPKTNASKTPQLRQTMTHSQKFPQDDTLSSKLDSISCAEILRRSSPTSKALHSLRLKIQQQKLRRATPASGVKPPEHLTRKVCRVASKEAKTAPGTGGVIKLSAQKQAVSSISPNACHQRSAPRVEQSTYISAWKNAQSLVKQILNPQSNIKADRSEWLNKKAPCSNKPEQEENSSEKPSRPMKALGMSRPISCSPSEEMFSSSAPSPCPVKALRLTNRNRYLPKTTQNPASKIFTEGQHQGSTKTASSAAANGKENDAQANLNRKPRHDVEEVREYIRRQDIKRRKKVLRMKKEAKREDERRQRNLQEVFRKQREALHRARKEEQQDYEYRGSSEEEEKCAHVPDTAEEQLPVFALQNRCVKVSTAEQVDRGSGTLAEAGSGMSAAEEGCLAAHRHRVEALRKTIAALDTRLDDEAAWPGVTGHKEPLRQTQPVGQEICGAESRATLSDCVYSNRDTETDLRQNTVSIQKEIKDDEVGMSPTDLGLCAAERDFKQQTDQTEQEDQSQSPDSESTDSISKWSELSELYSQQIHSHLSLAQSQQFLREEELRARQYSALYRLREKALWEKTQAELEWLEHCMKHETAQDNALALAELKRKQEAVVHRFRQEQAEIHHWRNIYRSGRQQRRLLLRHQSDILDIKQSTAHFKQLMQKQTVPKKSQNAIPENTAGSTEEDVVMQPGIMPDAGGTYKASREEGRQTLTRLELQVETIFWEWQQHLTGDLKEDRLLLRLLACIEPLCDGSMPVMNRSGLLSKAGLRRLLQSDEVWSLARKRNQVELVPAEQDILQIAESNNPPSSLSHRYPRQSPSPLCLISPERLAKTEGGNTPCQHDSVKTLKAGSNINEQDTPKKVQGFYEDTRTSRCNESCRGERLQHPAEGPLKPVLNIQHFTLEHEPNPDSHRAPIGSGFSSDTTEGFQLDSKDGHLKLKEQENTKRTTVAHSSVTADALNVKNNQRLRSVLLLNNNHDICDEDSGVQWKSSISYSKSDGDREFPEQNTQASTNKTVTDTPLLRSDTRKAEDSPSCDVSPSETDEKSEVISLHSEPLAWSKEEKERLNEKNADASMCSVVFAEKYIVVPEASQYELDLYDKDGEGHNYSPHYERQMTVESILSEILSPVDEVLSYGSAELPPSNKGGAESGPDSYSCPPHPAFEIITWTSEEELLVPADFLEDLSINSENLPPLPVDVSLRRRESQSLASSSLREKEVNSDNTNGDLFKTLPPSVCEDDENACSEYTSSLPEDAKDEISDPLSSFQIGERVLVCNSRPGVLKYKGLTAFADGFWAGVALDTPNGNHNGTFRGVKYFSCDKSHGVLVRAEDISHIHREHGSDIETGVDEDPFSDEEPPSTQRDKQQKGTSSSVGGQGEHTNSCRPPRDDSIPPKNTLQKEPQEYVSNGTKDLLYPSEKPSTRISVYELIHHNGENRHLVDDSNHSDAELTHKSEKDVVQCTQDTRKKQRMKSMPENTHIDTGVRKSEDSYLMPCLLEQWHQTQPDTPPKIKVPPHEDAIVYKLVDAAVEVLCGQTNDDALDCYQTPNYLLDDKSCKAYRQVIFQLTSDVLHDILGDLLRTKQSCQNIDNESVISPLQSTKVSVTFLKAAVRKEIQKALNLERNEQRMTEMLQKLCKYWYAKRDRVDYILIQELHNEERTWLDYTTDQYTVKMRLTEEIFSLLLDDTILTLSHMNFST